MRRRICLILGTILLVCGVVSINGLPVLAEVKEPIVIGVMMPQTGGAATEGAREVKAIQLAIEEINELGGVLGRPLEAIFEDTETRPKAGMEAVHKLVDFDKVPLIIGAHTSGVTIPTATYSNSKGVIQISIDSTSPDVRHLGPYHFSITGLDDLMGRYVAQFAMEDSGKKKWGIMVMNDPYGVGLAKEMQKEIERLGGEVVTLVKYEMGKIDYRPELQRLFTGNPEGILSVQWGEMAKVQFQQAYELGLSDRVKGHWYVPYPQDPVTHAIPETVEGMKGLDTHWGGYRSVHLIERWEKRYPGEEMSSYVPRPYDATWVAALAIGIAGSTEPDRILKALPLVFSFYKGASQVNLEVDADGMQKSEVYASYIIQNGKLVPYGKGVIGG